MFDIQRDMPLNSLASYLNSIDFFFRVDFLGCPSELRKRLLKLAFRVYGNSPVRLPRLHSRLDHQLFVCPY